MPRMKKIAEKKVNTKKNQSKEEHSELDSLFKNSETEAREDESELEDDVDDLNLNLQALEFHQFMQLAQDSESGGAPGLERIAGSAPRPIFVGGIPQGPSVGGNEESREEFKYVPGTANANEPKYFSEPGANAPERLDLTQERKTNITGFREESSQARFFMQSEPRIESQSQERFERPQRFDAETGAGRGHRNPLERQDTRYEKYKPKLPKS